MATAAGEDRTAGSNELATAASDDRAAAVNELPAAGDDRAAGSNELATAAGDGHATGSRELAATTASASTRAAAPALGERGVADERAHDQRRDDRCERVP
jgi:hypothetical protein